MDPDQTRWRILTQVRQKAVAFFSSTMSLIVLFTLTAIVRLIYFAVMWSLPLSGDEGQYFNRSAHVLNLVGVDLLGGVSVSESVRVLVGPGRFLPGMTAVLAPFRLFSDSLAVQRVGIGVLNLLILLLVIVLVRKHFGTLAASITLAILGFFPRMIAFSYVFWGEYLGGHLLIVLLLILWGYHRKIGAGARIGRVFPWLGPAVLLTVLIYIRLNVIFFVPVILLFIFMMFWNVHDLWPAIRRAFVPIALVTSIVIAGLAPWSYAISRVHDGFYPLTVQGDLAQIVNLGQPEDVSAADEFGSGHPFVRWYNYIEYLAEAEGMSFRAVAQRERNRIVGASDYGRYYEAVRNGLERYFREFGFLARFQRLASESSPERAPLINEMFNIFRIPNFLIWYGLLWTAIALMFVRLAPSDENWWLAYILKMVFVMSMVPAFLGGLLGERRGVILVPILAVSVAVLIATRPKLSKPFRSLASPVERMVWLIEFGVGLAFVAGFAFYFQTYLFRLV